MYKSFMETMFLDKLGHNFSSKLLILFVQILKTFRVDFAHLKVVPEAH